MKTPDELIDTIEWTPMPPHATDVPDDGIPWATHEGVLHIGNAQLKAYMLSNGQRVFDADDVQRFFSGGE